VASGEEMNEELLNLFLQSWECREGNRSTIEEILNWVEERNSTLQVNINQIPFKECNKWIYSEAGTIKHENNGFFEISGIREERDGKVVSEQPVLLQYEIGYLGILCKKINGVLNFLMQAKIEPGNVNKIQISPTIQATKSNFTQKHGGRQPAYLEYFNSHKGVCIVDQLQSEQASRFLRKRNRNIILYVEEEVEVLPSHKWMTLGQIKELMKIDNLVNMDTRTVLSCIPYSGAANFEVAGKNCFFETLFHGKADIITPFQKLNDWKMYNECETKLVPLCELSSWEETDFGWKHKDSYHFEVIYCGIEIEGREVRKWAQPLFKANGRALFGMLTFVENGERKFVIQISKEIGSFDTAEFGPTLQLESGWEKQTEFDIVQKLFFEKWEEKQNVMCDVLLSEEGGRFFEEENRNVIVEIKKEQLPELSDKYLIVNFNTLNELTQYPDCLNIQLRNLLSLLDYR